MKCSRCKMDLPQDNFYERKDGKKRSWCKSCIARLSKTPQGKKQNRKYFHSEQGKQTLTRYRSTEKYKETKRRWNNEYIKRPDIKRKKTARERIRYRVKTGKLPHPTQLICEYCHINSATEYHHYNGYDTNDVKAICSDCHRSISSQFQRIDKD